MAFATICYSFSVRYGDNFGCIVVNVFTEDNEENKGEKYKIFVNLVALCEIFYRR